MLPFDGPILFMEPSLYCTTVELMFCKMKTLVSRCGSLLNYRYLNQLSIIYFFQLYVNKNSINTLLKIFKGTRDDFA